MKAPKVKRESLLRIFNRICKKLNKKSHGFDFNAIDGKDQWAMKYRKGCGWMIVCGGDKTVFDSLEWSSLFALEFFNFSRWSLLMMLEGIDGALNYQEKNNKRNCK